VACRFTPAHLFAPFAPRAEVFVVPLGEKKSSDANTADQSWS